MRNLSPATLVLTTLTLSLFISCSTPTLSPVPGHGELQQSQRQECDPIVEEFEHVKADADVAFGNAVGKVNAGGSFERVREIKNELDDIQRDYQLKSSNLCRELKSNIIDKATYSRHRLCMDQALTAMRAMERVFKDAPEGADPKHMTWLTEAKMDWLKESLACHERAVTQPQAFPTAPPTPSSPQPCPTTRGGVINGGALTLISNQGTPLQTCQPINLQAHLLCQRQSAPNQFADVPNCNGASLRQGDRFKVEFSSNQNASFYFFLYNSTGQFQMFFPDQGVPNQTQANTTYQLPPGSNWITVDDVSGVLEHIQLVAATYPLQELENLRGADLPPNAQGQLQVVASQTRGRIEPIATRGGRIEPIATRGGTYQGDTMMLTAKPQPNAANTQVPMNITANGTDVAAVEFTFNHTP